ncbi:hypothetical protein RHGRI_001111 [Rhododendron griersonianum]|uniref:CCHC-type domain-containing protein n=1 Tax=Rhododendron griersonianum TaxID=479676 RepID=A0AAV6LJ03_9ERIC|nr:hypothetical protein RHGRI_001111 [Rhododendron griersonianum]
MTEHLNDYNKILADLLNLDVEILDEDKALLLLNSLPKDYDHLSTTLMYGKDTIKFDDVSNALVNNEYRKRDMQAHGDSGEALSVRGRSENRKNSSNRGRSNSKGRGASTSSRVAKDECTYCREKGHWKKDCPKKRGKDSFKANIVHFDDDDSNLALLGSC